MIRIGHFSDLHGNYGRLAAVFAPDVWICTGDFFPNKTRGYAPTEEPFQTAWFNHHAEAILTRLQGRPLIWVAGNHDYVNLATLLRTRGGVAWDATEAPVDFMGERFAGFREIPYIQGEWAGEETNLRPIVGRTMAADPTILLTHAPPAGILDDDGGRGHGFGVVPLTSALLYTSHRIHTHLFGHIHQQGGRDVREMDTRFYNGATGCRLIEV